MSIPNKCLKSLVYGMRASVAYSAHAQPSMVSVSDEKFTPIL